MSSNAIKPPVITQGFVRWTADTHLSDVWRAALSTTKMIIEAHSKSGLYVAYATPHANDVPVLRLQRVQSARSTDTARVDYAGTEVSTTQKQADPTAAVLAAETDPAIMEAVAARLFELRALLEDEGGVWNSVAEKQLYQMLDALPSPARPAIAADNNGDLRVLWENMLREQVGIRFKGQSEMEAVLFQKTEHGFRREVVKAGKEAVVSLIREMKLIHVTRG